MHRLAAILRSKHLVQRTALLGLRPVEIKVRLRKVGIIAIGGRDKLFECVGRHKVIGLQDAHVLATRHLQTVVHRVAVAAVGLVDHLDAPIALHILADNRRRVVGRPVINADDLNILERLRQGGIEALAQVALNIVNGNKQRQNRAARGVSRQMCSLGNTCRFMVSKGQRASGRLYNLWSPTYERTPCSLKPHATYPSKRCAWSRSPVSRCSIPFSGPSRQPVSAPWNMPHLRCSPIPACSVLLTCLAAGPTRSSL